MTAEHRIVSHASVLVIALVCALGDRTAEAQSSAPAEVYQFNTLALGGEGPDSYVDRFAGSDLLPYTDDDVEVPARGNVGGTWGFAHHDLNSDGVVDEDEPVFVVIRRDDDDQFGFTINSHPEYGLIYEAEDWIDYHEARNRGPSATLIGDLGAEGNDFEHNDRPTWEGESNAFLYNNLRANQHGKGKPRWYFEHINPGSTAANDEPFVIDEIEGFQKPLSFQNNLDDPTTPFNERGDCRSDYFRTFDAVTRGYLIPIAAVEDLEDGSLESLFGWEPEGFDLAAYLRDVIYPKLWDPDDPSEPNPDVTMYHTVSGTQPTNFPLTHLMLMQIEVPIVVNQGGSCGAGAAAAQAMADYWGIPPTGATYRVSHILGANHDLVDAILGIGTIHPWLDEAEDGEERNLWHLDHFFRDGDTHLGKYEFSPPGATFSLRLDPTFGVIDNTFNRIFESVGGMAVAQLPRALGVDELPVELVVDLGSDAEDVAFQIGLLSEGEPVAWAQVSNQASLVALGGEGVDDGWFSGAGASQEGDAGGFGGVEIGDFARYVLRITPERVSLLEALRDEFAINDFSGLDPEVMDEIAFLDLSNAEVIAGIDAIAVAVDGSGAFSTIALLAAPPGSFTPGTGGLQRAADCNQDGNLDISDGVCLLGHLFLGNPSTLPCEGGTTNDPGNLALLDSDGNGGIQLTDAIAIFSFLFQGGAVPTICVDPLCAECIPIEGCPSVCN